MYFLSQVGTLMLLTLQVQDLPDLIVQTETDLQAELRWEQEVKK